MSTNALRMPVLRRKARAGMTMVELIVATVIFSMLIAMSFQISMSTTRSASEKLLESTVQVKAERTLKMLSDEIVSADSLAPIVSADGSSITIQIPMDHDGDGTTLDKSNNFNLELGAVTSGGSLYNGTITYRFVQQKSLSEATEGLDLNADNDQNDSFDMGYLEKTSTINGDTTSVIGVTNIIQRQGNYGASILADANPASDNSGRIFTKLNTDGNLIQVSLWLVAISEDRMPHLIQSKVQLFLRNR